MRVHEALQAALQACVWLRRQPLREPLRAPPLRLPEEAQDLRGAQRGLLLQRYAYSSWLGGVAHEIRVNNNDSDEGDDNDCGT